MVSFRLISRWLILLKLFVDIRLKFPSLQHGTSMPERPGSSVPRRSLCPTVQPETSPFHWAKSSARTTPSTQHVRPPSGFCHSWNSLPGPVCNSDASEDAFRRLLKTFLFAWRERTYCSALGRSKVRRWCAIQIDILTLTLTLIALYRWPARLLTWLFS